MEMKEKKMHVVDSQQADSFGNQCIEYVSCFTMISL